MSLPNTFESLNISLSFSADAANVENRDESLQHISLPVSLKVLKYCTTEID